MQGAALHIHFTAMKEEVGWFEEEETLEDLHLGGLRLIQKKEGFRFGMDSVLLADFAQARTDDLVVDFGTGTGILPLLMIGRGKGGHYIGLEIQKEMAEMACRTMKLNHLDHMVEIRCMDISEAPGFLPACSVDVIVCNPPYGMPGRVMTNRTEALSTARHFPDSERERKDFPGLSRCADVQPDDGAEEAASGTEKIQARISGHKASGQSCPAGSGERCPPKAATDAAAAHL